MKSLKLLVVTLSIAMLMAVSACAEPPPPTPIPVYTPNFTEAEVIALTRESQVAKGDSCWYRQETKHPDHFVYSNQTTTASASLKKNGLWVVTASSSYTVTKTELEMQSILSNGGKPQKTQNFLSECTFLLDDATGQVIPR